MRIAITNHREKKDVLQILVDGEPWKDIHIAVFGRRPSLPKQVSSLEELKELFNALEYRQAKNYVLRRLSMQSYYSGQLEKLLRERLICLPTVKRLLEECESWGYLNDEAWLDSFVRGHAQRSSMRVISMKLRAKGVHEEIIQQLIEKWHDPETERLAVEKLIQSKSRSKNLKDPKERQKMIASLMRKGYSFDTIKAAFLATKTT